MSDDDFTLRHTTMANMMRQVELPAEIVQSVKAGSIGYKGVALAVKVAGEDVIVIARDLSKLNTVFNYVVADLHGGSSWCKTETLRTSACPEVVVVARTDTTLDDEL